MEATNSRDQTEIISVPEYYVVEEIYFEGRRVRYASCLRAGSSFRCTANSSAEQNSSQPPMRNF